MRLLHTFCMKKQKKVNKLFGLLKIIITFADVNCFFIFILTNQTLMKRMFFDHFSKQALQELHRYRAVMFSPTFS